MMSSALRPLAVASIWIAGALGLPGAKASDFADPTTIA